MNRKPKRKTAKKKGNRSKGPQWSLTSVSRRGRKSAWLTGCGGGDGCGGDGGCGDGCSCDGCGCDGCGDGGGGGDGCGK